MPKPLNNWTFLKIANQKATFEVSLDFGNEDVDIDEVELWFLNKLMPLLKKSVGSAPKHFRIKRK